MDQEEIPEVSEDEQEGPTQNETSAPAGLAHEIREYAKIAGFTLLVALFLRFFVIEAYRIPTASMEQTLYVGDFLLVNKFVYGARTPRYVPLTDVPLPSFTLPALKRPDRGDVVVFESPAWKEDPSNGITNFVKRCVGLPGDTVQIVHGFLSVNGKRVPLPPGAKQRKWIPSSPGYADPRIYPRGAPFSADEYGPVVVPWAGRVVTLSSHTIDSWSQLIGREGHTVNVKNDVVLIDGNPSQSYTVGENYYFMMGDNRSNSLDSRFWGFVPEHLIIGKAMLVYWSWDQTASSDSFL